MDLDPRLLRIFAVVLRTGSVTRTAEELSTSQPSVTKALRRLESTVGFRLFEKRGRNLFPTAEGNMIADDAKHIEREIEAVRRRVSEIRRGRRQSVSVATLPTFATNLLPRALVELRQKSPKASVKIEAWSRSLVLSEFDAGRFDIGLIFTTSEYAPAGFEIVANAPVCCLLPIGHRLCRKREITPTDLRNEKLLMYHSSLDVADPIWRVLDSLSPPPEIFVEASQAALLRDLVRHKLGVALVDGFTSNDPTFGDLVVRPFSPSIPCYLAIAIRQSNLPYDSLLLSDILKKEALAIATKASS